MDRSTAQKMVGYGDDRAPLDSYATGYAATYALVRSEARRIPGRIIWEPAAGNMAMMAPLFRLGSVEMIYASDIAPLGGGVRQLDFLRTYKFDLPTRRQEICTAIVTNPPFKLAEHFARHAWHNLGIDYLALLCKTTFLNGIRRGDIVSQVSRVLVFRDRPKMSDFRRKTSDRSGQSMMDFAWFIWDRKTRDPGRAGEYPPILEWIHQSDGYYPPENMLRSKDDAETRLRHMLAETEYLEWLHKEDK